MKWLKKIFGVKDKVEEKPNKSYIPKDLELEERKISPLLTEEQPLSVPIEEKFVIENNSVLIKNFESIEVEEPIAPTLERQDDFYKEPIKGETIEKSEDRILNWAEKMKAIPQEKKDRIKKYLDELDEKNKKPKKQAKKKGDGESSKPKGNNFLM